MDYTPESLQRAWSLYNELWRTAPSRPRTQPSEIIDGLYISNWDFASDARQLKAFNITAIVNCAASRSRLDTLPYQVNADTDYLGLPIVDVPSFDIAQFFDAATDFIQEHRMANRSVLVHCEVGMSRSVTIVAAYLVRYHMMDPAAALRLIKDRRPLALPNVGFIEQLQRWAAEL